MKLVSVLPSTNTESHGPSEPAGQTELSTVRNELNPKPPDSDVRAMRCRVLMRTSPPSHCSAFGLLGSSRSSLAVPMWNGGTGFPELTLRTMMSGEACELLLDRISVSPWKSPILPYTTTLSPMTRPRLAARFEPPVKTSMPVHGVLFAPTALFWM